VSGGVSPDVRLRLWVTRHFPLVLYSTALVAYLFGVWWHIPYGGGHVYSDIVTVFQDRECGQGSCTLLVPYIQTFDEYPVITAMFMYLMGQLGNLFGGSLVSNYYWFTSAFLTVPTLLLVREMLKIAEMRKTPPPRLLWYFVVTPTFVFMLLVNWYVIGVFFAVAGLRRYLQGGLKASGVLFGLSAASNLITAIPALGLLIASKSGRERVTFVTSAVAVYGAINLPFVILNEHLWLQAFNYAYGWYIEYSWMLVLSADIWTPLRHSVALTVFAVIIAGMVWLRYRRGVTDPVVLAFLSMFGYVFSTYIYTPQINLAFLPFFVLLPVASGYWEFLAFDTANSLVILLGFSQALLPLGITYSFDAFTRFDLIWWIAVIRSFWLAKFMLFSRIRTLRSALPWTGKGALKGQQQLFPEDVW